MLVVLVLWRDFRIFFCLIMFHRNSVCVCVFVFVDEHCLRMFLRNSVCVCVCVCVCVDEHCFDRMFLRNNGVCVDEHCLRMFHRNSACVSVKTASDFFTGTMYMQWVCVDETCLRIQSHSSEQWVCLVSYS